MQENKGLMGAHQIQTTQLISSDNRRARKFRKHKNLFPMSHVLDIALYSFSSVFVPETGTGNAIMEESHTRMFRCDPVWYWYTRYTIMERRDDAVLYFIGKIMGMEIYRIIHICKLQCSSTTLYSSVS